LCESVDQGPELVSEPPLVHIDKLSVAFSTEERELEVVTEVSFDMVRGETVALVGESGCGKSVSALALLGLLDDNARVTAKALRFDSQNILEASADQLRTFRGKRIGMIFQEPMTSLNPVFRIGDQIAEVLEQHFDMSAEDCAQEVVRLLDLVGIPAPERRAQQYPHELSGGMTQRVMIAMAIACKPELLIADEPTTALDVTIQAQILVLLKKLQQETGMAVLLITHNLGVVAHFAQRVMVMYAGTICEKATVGELFSNPRHPYTQALLRALPSPTQQLQPLSSIAGSVPSPEDFPAGCRFHTRCPKVLDSCLTTTPSLRDIDDEHQLACHLDD